MRAWLAGVGAGPALACGEGSGARCRCRAEFQSGCHPRFAAGQDRDRCFSVSAGRSEVPVLRGAQTGMTGVRGVRGGCGRWAAESDCGGEGFELGVGKGRADMERRRPPVAPGGKPGQQQQPRQRVQKGHQAMESRKVHGRYYTPERRGADRNPRKRGAGALPASALPLCSRDLFRRAMAGASPPPVGKARFRRCAQQGRHRPG